MYTPQIFVTGATGYIGGDALHTIIEAHPDWQYTCLVRSSEKGSSVVTRYPHVHLVYGDLSSVELIEEESKKADVVLHFADADDAPSANAIVAGLSAHTADRPGYYIHTSGTGILCYADAAIGALGESSNKIWDDVKDISEIVSIPDEAPHREVDKIVLAAATGVAAKAGKVKTAIVCPPCIYGFGRGTGNTRSIQIPSLIEAFLKRGQAFQVGGGKTRWSNVHVHDLSRVYLSLAEDAVLNKGGRGSWGEHGYFYAENGEQVWGEVSKSIGEKVHKLGYLSSADAPSLGMEEVKKINPYGPVLYGQNSRSRASRVRKELFWNPTGISLEEHLDEVIESEIRRVGLSKGHAAKAAGDA